MASSAASELSPGASRGPGTISEVWGRGIMGLWDVGPKGGLGEASLLEGDGLCPVVVRREP